MAEGEAAIIVGVGPGLGASLGLGPTFLVMAVGAAAGGVAALALWPRHDPEVIEHELLPMEHAHGEPDPLHHALDAADRERGRHRHRPIRHAHAFGIDDHHLVWPGR